MTQTLQTRSSLYGSRGWTRELADTLEPFIYRHDCLGTDDGYIRLYGIDSVASHELRQLIPDKAMADRQNNAPPLSQLLDVCIQAGKDIDLSGYLITDQRSDERLTIDAMTVYRLPGMEGELSLLNPQTVWTNVMELFPIGTPMLAPDEVVHMQPHWAHGREGWWLWWD